jgi:hypothetical protein
MYYGSFTLTVESETAEKRNDLMDRLFQFLADNVEDYRFEGFEETEQHWNDSSRKVKLYGDW